MSMSCAAACRAGSECLTWHLDLPSLLPLCIPSPHVLPLSLPAPTRSGRAECVLADAWERLRLVCSHNSEAQRYDFADVLARAADLGAKRLIICDPGAWCWALGGMPAPARQLCWAVDAAAAHVGAPPTHPFLPPLQASAACASRWPSTWPPAT